MDKVYLTNLDRENDDKLAYAKGLPKINLEPFIDLLLVKATGAGRPLPIFYNLVEEHGLVVYDYSGVTEYDESSRGQVVPSSELLDALRQREGAKLVDDYFFPFWESMDKESRYFVYPEDVERAYSNAGKTQFPWRGWDREFIWLDVKEPSEAVGGVGAGSQTQDKRQSQLYIFIWRVHQFLTQKKKPTAQGLWNEIQHRHEDHDTGKIIQEVDGKQILWCSGYGNEQILKRSSFDKTLSNLRKTPPF